MFRNRYVALGLIVSLLAGCWRGASPVVRSAAAPLEGTWEIISVQQDGTADSLQAGAHLTFAGDQVTFEPKAPAVADFAG